MDASIRVLHVDDDLDFSKVTVDMLSTMGTGLEVVTANRVGDALERLDTNDIDCIISDYDMPQRNGIEFLELVRATHPDLPFILFTGKGSEEIASDAITAGVTDYLQKGGGREQYAMLANRIENAVERARARSNYREIFEKTPDGILLHDPEDGAILDANEQCSSLFGYEREEMLSLTFDELHAGDPPYTTERAQALLSETLDVGHLTFEWHIRTKQDDTVPVEVHLSRTTVDGDEVVLAAVRDITDRRARQQELERARDRMEVALDVTTAAVWEWDIENDEVTVHPSIHPVFDRRIDSSSTYLEEVHPHDRDRVEQALDRAIEDAEPFHVEFRVDRAGTTRWVEDHGELRERRDGHQLLVGVSRDVTARKRRERLLEAERDRLYGLIEMIPEPVAQLAMIDGEPIIRAVNQAYEETFGVNEEAAVGRSNNEFVVPEGRMDEARSIDRQIVEGESVVREVRRQATDGVRDFLMRSVPVGDTAGSEALDCFVIYIDISEQKRREANLERLKQRYQAYVEHASDIIVVLDEEGAIEYISPVVGDVLGCAHEDLIGSPVLEHVHEDDRQAAAELVQLDTGDGQQRVECRLTSADDGWVWMEAIASRQSDGTVVLSARDISGRKRRETERARNERYRQRLYQLASDPRLGPEETVTRLLELGRERLGMSTGYVTRIDPSTGGYEVIRAVGELVDEGMRTDLEDTYCSDTIEAGDVLAIADAEADGFEEHPSYVSFGLAAYIGGRLLVDDDGFGTICFIDDEPRPHAFTSEDKVFVELLSRWISQLYDRVYREQVITELHQVASELARCGTREEVFDVTIDVAASLLDFDRSGIAVAEQGALRIVAMSDQLALDESPTMDVEEGVAGRTFQTGESYLIVDVSRFNDVEPTLEIGSAISIPIGDIGVFQVITEVEDAFDEHDLALAELLVRHTENALVRLERERELRRQNERLEQFSSVLSHDLRNPLSVATGHVELMRESCDDPSVETAANALERMDEIIDGTLSLARRGELITRVETVELAAVARQSWATVSSGNASLDLDGDAIIRADPDRLRHVFENLFRNAVEHAGDGVTIRVGPIERSGIYVEDDGMGIGDIDTERLFEPGYSTRPEGTGFGLAIVKEVVDAHDWEIEVGSSDDGGARFELTNVRFD